MREIQKHLYPFRKRTRTSIRRVFESLSSFKVAYLTKIVLHFVFIGFFCSAYSNTTCLKDQQDSFFLANKQKKQLLVFISFSLPDKAILSIDESLQNLNGYFVVRGFPNGFAEQFFSRVISLKQQGLCADITIDPDLFAKYSVKEIPCFVALQDRSFDKVTGNLPLNYVLDLFETSNQSALQAKELGNTEVCYD